MNVDRMRRYSEGAREEAQRQDRAAWLDALEPEHRAFHQSGSLGAIACRTCINASARAAGEQMARVMSRMGAKR